MICGTPGCGICTCGACSAATSATTTAQKVATFITPPGFAALSTPRTLWLSYAKSDTPRDGDGLGWRDGHRDAHLPHKARQTPGVPQDLPLQIDARPCRHRDEDSRAVRVARGSGCLFLHARLPRRRVTRADEGEVLRGRVVETRTRAGAAADAGKV